MDRFEDAKLRIKEATDLVALIESYMPLRPRGRTLVALCPFHAENSPSFTVYRDSQHFHCFGCGKSGDAYTWLQEREGLSFREAMEVLADRVGVSLEGVFKGPRAGSAKSEDGLDAFQTLAEVAAFFQRCLLVDEGRLAHDYVAGRGLAEAIEPWRLGYHPRPGALLRFAQEKKLRRDWLEHAGLVRNGREVFVGRLMFPIEDERGRVVAFGGRLVPGAPGSAGDGDYKPPKYLNSPESPIFSKRRVLYGLHRSKLAGERRIVVVEGYTDVIACHLAGFRGAVATLGTAFTADHARIVQRYATEGVVLMFDGDRAGLQAAERANRELVNSRLAVRIALMGEVGSGGAKDPADVVTARDGEDPELVAERRARFGDTVDAAEDAMTVWFRLLRRRLDLTQAVHVETAAHECADMLALVTEPVRQAALLQEMARHLAVPAPTLERLLRKARPPARAAGQVAANGQVAASGRGEAALPQAPARAPRSLAERTDLEVLACVLKRPDLLIDLDRDDPFGGDGVPLGDDVAALLALAAEAVALGRSEAASLAKYLFAAVAESPALRQVLGESVAQAQRIGDARAVFTGLVAGRRRLHNGTRRRQLRQQLQAAFARGDKHAAAAIQEQLLACLREDRPLGADRAGRDGEAAPVDLAPVDLAVGDATGGEAAVGDGAAGDAAEPAPARSPRFATDVPEQPPYELPAFESSADELPAADPLAADPLAADPLAADGLPADGLPLGDAVATFPGEIENRDVPPDDAAGS